jgi:hypothetical protein
LDAIEDRVVPGRIVERRKERLRSRFSDIKDTVMGWSGPSQGNGGGDGHLSDRLSDATEWAHQAPETARQQAQGNPLAAGLIAFGAGLLAAAVFPGTDTEGQVAQKVQEVAKPLAEEVKQTGQDLVSDLQPSARQAAQQVKETAVAGAGQVKDTASRATEDTKGAASQAAGEVTDQAQKSAQAVRDQS